MATSEPVDRGVEDVDAPEFTKSPGPLHRSNHFRAIGALILIASGFGLYEYVLVSFWSVPWMASTIESHGPRSHPRSRDGVLIAGLRLALDSIRARQARFGCSRSRMHRRRRRRRPLRQLRDTRDAQSAFTLKIAVGQQFQHSRSPIRTTRFTTVGFRREPTLIYLSRRLTTVRRFELAELTAHLDDFAAPHRYACDQHRSGRAIEDASRIPAHGKSRC